MAADAAGVVKSVALAPSNGCTTLPRLPGVSSAKLPGRRGDRERDEGNDAYAEKEVLAGCSENDGACACRGRGGSANPVVLTVGRLDMTVMGVPIAPPWWW